jgi:hypothetical protein
VETKEYTTIDRKAAEWPSGEWDGEPDKVQWQDKETGLPCMAKRHDHSGHWCGYVGVAEGHPAFGVGYDDVRIGEEWPSVHGGLTYADFCDKDADEARGICHLPSEGEPTKVWWLGFDCAHSGDYGPRDKFYERTLGYPFTCRPDAQYRTLAYVKNECASLARQLSTDSENLGFPSSNATVK